MARNYGQVLTSIWTDGDFLALDPSAQRLFFFLISQSGLSHAGLLPLRIRPWSTKATGLTVDDLWQQLKALEASRFVLVDEDTEELLIRTHVKGDGLWKQPKMLLAAGSDAAAIESRRLLEVFHEELGRLPEDAMTDAGREALTKVRVRVAERLAAMPRNPFPGVQETPPDTPTQGYPLARGGTPSPTPAPVPRSHPVPPTAGAVAPTRTEQPALVPDTAPPTPRSDNVRAQDLAKTYVELVPLSKFPAVLGIAKAAIRAGYSDQAIQGALERIAKDGRPLTVDVLRVELDGLPTRRQSGAAAAAVHDLSQQDYSDVRI